MTGHEIGQRARIAHALKDLLDHLVGQSRLLAELGGALAYLTVQRYERGIPLIERGQVGRFAHGRLEVAVRFGVVNGDTTTFAVQNELDAAQVALDLTDLRNRPGRVENARRDLVHVR